MNIRLNARFSRKGGSVDETIFSLQIRNKTLTGFLESPKNKPAETSASAPASKY